MLWMTAREGFPAASEALATDPGRAELKREDPELEDEKIAKHWPSQRRLSSASEITNLRYAIA
jgi:hypothetical protein